MLLGRECDFFLALREVPVALGQAPKRCKAGVTATTAERAIQHVRAAAEQRQRQQQRQRLLNLAQEGPQTRLGGGPAALAPLQDAAEPPEEAVLQRIVPPSVRPSEAHVTYVRLPEADAERHAESVEVEMSPYEEECAAKARENAAELRRLGLARSSEVEALLAGGALDASEYDRIVVQAGGLEGEGGALGEAWAKRVHAAYQGVRGVMERPFHDAEAARDEPELRISNFGWSQREGGARTLEPFWLKCTGEGERFFSEHIVPTLPCLWAACKTHFPMTCAAMEAAVPRRSKYRLHPDVPVTKISCSDSAPTPVHTDRANVGCTLLMSWEITPGKGGSHVIISRDLERAVVVADAAYGVACFGPPYRTCPHANMACKAGKRRFVLTAYCGEDLVRWASSM